MIYIGLKQCENNYNSQHTTAYSLLSDILNRLGYYNFEIKKSKNGRPFVLNTDFDISISHSDTVAVVAIITPKKVILEDCIMIDDTGRHIGVDVEHINTKKDLKSQQKLALRFLHASVSSSEEFYRLWTENESYGKMTGEGVISKRDVPCRTFSFLTTQNGNKYFIGVSIK